MALYHAAINSWRSQTRLVDAAEIVECEPEAVGSPQVLHFLPKPLVNLASIRICILMLRFWRSTWLRENLRLLGFHDWDLLRVGDFGGTVPGLVIGGLRINLDELREVQRSLKVVVIADLYGWNPSVVIWIRCGAAATRKPSMKASVVGWFRSAKSEIQNEFGVSFVCHKVVGVADPAIVAGHSGISC